MASGTRSEQLTPTSVALVILACSLWGATSVVAKLALAGGVPPFTVGALRATLASLFLLPAVLIVRPRFPRTAPAWGIVIALGFLQTAIPFSAMFWSVQYIGAGLAMVLMCTQPFWVALFSHYFLADERLTRATVLGLVVGFAGVVLVASDHLGQQSGPAWIGMLVILAGAACWGLGTILMRNPAGASWSPLTLAFGQMPVAALVMLLFVTPIEGFPSFNYSATAWGVMVWLALINSAFVYFLWIYLIRRHGATRVSAFVFLQPVSAFLLSGLVFGEALTPLTLVGLALVGWGIYRVNTAGRAAKPKKSGVSSQNSAEGKPPALDPPATANRGSLLNPES